MRYPQQLARPHPTTFVSRSKHVATCLLVVVLFIILMVRKVFCAVSRGGKVGTFKSVNIFTKWPVLNIMGCILGGRQTHGKTRAKLYFYGSL